MPEIVAQRMFQPIYILLDSVFLVALCAMLFFRRRYLTLLFGLFGGILYFVVDYGIFHLWLGTRSIEGGSLFWVLLWMSLSYGVTNFVLIWTWISKDENAREWTLFILLWWFVCPLLTDALGNGDVIKIQRTTGAYHGWMAAILFLSYAALILFNIFRKDKSLRFPLLRLFLIGVFVQFGWELSLLIGGIRSAGIESAAENADAEPEKTLSGAGRQADGIACQFVVGDQSRHAADLYYIPADNICFYGRPETARRQSHFIRAS